MKLCCDLTDGTARPAQSALRRWPAGDQTQHSALPALTLTQSERERSVMRLEMRDDPCPFGSSIMLELEVEDLRRRGLLVTQPGDGRMAFAFAERGRESRDLRGIVSAERAAARRRYQFCLHCNPGQGPRHGITALCGEQLPFGGVQCLQSLARRLVLPFLGRLVFRGTALWPSRGTRYRSRRRSRSSQ